MASTHPLEVIIALLAVLMFCSIHIDAVRVSNSVDSCGYDHLKCPSRPHSDRSCKNGQCGFTCKGSWRDCDYIKSNGCETDVEENPGNCGKCRNRCPVPANSRATCDDGECGFECKESFTRRNNCCVLIQSPPPPPFFHSSPPPPPFFHSSPPPPPFFHSSPPPPPFFHSSPPPPPFFHSSPPPPPFFLSSPPPPPFFYSSPPPPPI